MDARRFSFLMAATVNVAMLCINVVVLALQAWHGSRLAVTNEAAACVSATCVFVLVVAERRIVTEQAIRDSYLQEQLTDTKMKAFMLEQVEAGKAGLGMTMSTPGPAGRSH